MAGLLLVTACGCAGPCATVPCTALVSAAVAAMKPCCASQRPCVPCSTAPDACGCVGPWPRPVAADGGFAAGILRRSAAAASPKSHAAVWVARGEPGASMLLL